MNDQTARRRKRMAWIEKVLNRIKEGEGKKEFNKNYFISNVMIKYGISRRIASEDVSAMVEVKW